MRNLCFRVITMAVGLYFTGAMTSPSGTNSIFFDAACQWDGCLLTNCSFAGKHDAPEDTSQTAARVNGSSSFLRVLKRAPTEEEEQTIRHLDLSNNLLSEISLSSLAHLRALELVNLSHNAIHAVSLGLPSPTSSWAQCHRSSWKHGLPYLKSLVLQRNKLTDVPKGLWKLKVLQSLDLSFNVILQISAPDFHGCLQLESLYLRSNKIFRIHPEAFKDLKKLQVVDLSSNALTAVLPMMAIALGLPRLDADLARNQWQCDRNVAAFQTFMSEIWRRKWDGICNKFIGNEAASRQSLKSRVSREIQLPHTNLNHMESLIRSKAAGPWEGTHGHFSTLGKKAHTGSDSRDQQRWPPRKVRSTKDMQRAGGKEVASQDLALAVCLAVFITFFGAFCLGAFSRPYIDRLWQQRCRKKTSSDCAHCNEGFYEEMEVAGNIQHPRVGLHHACHHLNLCKNQDPFSGMEASPQAAALAHQALGMSGKEPGSGESREQGGAKPGAGSGEDVVLLHGSAARSIIHRPPNANSSALISGKQGHFCRDDILGEVTYETEVQGESPSEYSRWTPVITGRLQTGSGSIQKDSNELDPPLSREMTAALSQTQTHTKAQGTGGKEERESTEQLPSEVSREMQASPFTSLLYTQEQRLEAADAEGEYFIYRGWATLSDLVAMGPSPPDSPPGGGSDPHVTPAHKEPGQEHVPLDMELRLDSNYDSDSDEGSLFTLCSTSSEDAGKVTEEEADDEESLQASDLPEGEDLRLREGDAAPFESLEDNITFQRSQEKCEDQEGLSETPCISGSDSGLCVSHLESASNTDGFENILTLAISPNNSPPSDKIPDMFTYGHVLDLQYEVAGWLSSLTDPAFYNVNSLPQPPCSAEVPSSPAKTACHERDLRTDTDPNNILPQSPSGENLRSSRQDSEGDNIHCKPLDTNTDENRDSREVISQAQLLQFCGDDPALQGERGGEEYFEEGSKSQVLLLQELPNNSQRTQEPLTAEDWGKDPEENLLQLEKDNSNFYTQMQTQSNLLGVECPDKDQPCSDEDKDVQHENQRE